MKVGDMVLVRMGYSLSFLKNSKISLMEIKRITKTLIIIGKYGSKEEVMKFKKCDNLDEKTSYIGINKTQSIYSSNNYLFTVKNDQVIKEHLENTIRIIDKEMKEKIVEYIGKYNISFESFSKIIKILDK